MPNISRFLFFPLSLCLFSCQNNLSPYIADVRNLKYSNKIKNEQQTEQIFVYECIDQPANLLLYWKPWVRKSHMLAGLCWEHGVRRTAKRENGWMVVECVNPCRRGSEVGNKMNIRNTHRHTHNTSWLRIFSFSYTNWPFSNYKVFPLPANMHTI